MNTRQELLQFCSIVENTLRNRLGDELTDGQRQELEVGLDAARSLQDAAQTLFGLTNAPGLGPEARDLAMDEIRRQPRLGRPFTPTPAFVIGHRRSGTTLLCWLLDSHPNLAAIPENGLCGAMFGGDGGMNAGGDGRLAPLLAMGSMLRFCIGEPREVFFGRCAQLVADVFLDYASRKGKPRWVAKEPFVASTVDLLDMAFDYQSRFIYIVRHGLDVAFSASERYELLDTPLRVGGVGLLNYLQEWCAANEAWASFVARNAERCLTVRYEDLVADPLGRSQEIFGFFGESPVATILDDMRRQEHSLLGDAKIHETGGAVDASRQGRWREWPDALLEQAGRIANPMLKRLGYHPVATTRLARLVEAGECLWQ